MSDRRDKAAARAARLEAERTAQHRAERGRRLRFALAAGVALAVVGIATAVLIGQPQKRQVSTVAAAAIPPRHNGDLAAAAHAANAKFTSYDYAYGINDHVTKRVDYPTNPPTNGPHYPAPAQDGNYAGAATPPTEQLVHSMEHGRIEIQYRKGLPQKRIQQLVALYDEAPQHVLLFENQTGMPCDVAVTAWGHGMLCPKFTDGSFDAIRAFRDKYRDKGPEFIP